MRILKRNKLLTIFGFLLLIVCTYFRENILLQINASLEGEVFHRSYIYLFADFFNNLSQTELTIWKWGVTIVVSSIMSAITIVSLHQWFQSYKLAKLTSYIYGITLIFVVLLAFISYLFGCFYDVYFILRLILGLVQSPIPFFAFFTLFYFLERK